MISYIPITRIKWMKTTLFPFYIYFSDLAVRYNYIKVLDSKGITNFSVSLLFELCFAFSIVYLLSIFTTKRKVAIGVFTFFFSVIQLIVYGHYFYFGVLPNNYSINYLFRSPSDSLALITGSLNWIHAFLFVILCLINYLIISYSVSGFEAIKKKYTYAILILFVINVFIFNNNVRFHPSSYSVSPATVFSLKYVIQQRMSGGDFQVEEGYVQRKFSIKEKDKISPSYNCLVLLSESLTRKNLQYYGYEKENSPFVDSMINKGNVILFGNHFANSVSTQYSMPMIFSGQFTLERINQPYIYDYLKKWVDIKTFFISSQSYQTDNFDLVINTSFDYFICQENSGQKRFNDRGIDDNLLISFFDSFIEKFNEEKFFGIIQFNNTHYPYKTASEKSKLFLPDTPGSLNSYDNTIYEQDQIIKSYFALLESNNLLDSTVIIFLADHGEAFSEHGHSGHLQTLYNEDIATPLWVFLPPSFSADKKNVLTSNTSIPTSNMDLFPTIFDLYEGLHYPDLNLLPFGNSLFSRINSNRFIPAAGMDMLDTKALINAPYKFIHTVKNGKQHCELFDITNDFNELNNLWKKVDNQTREYYLNELKKFDYIKFKGF